MGITHLKVACCRKFLKIRHLRRQTGEKLVVVVAVACCITSIICDSVVKKTILNQYSAFDMDSLQTLIMTLIV